MAGKFEYYITGDNAATGTYGVNWWAQTFTPLTAHTITSVKLKLYRLGSPGTVTVSIRATSGGKPIDADLTSGTTDGDTLTDSSSGEWREITLTNYALSVDTQYAIVIRALTGDENNYVGLRYDTTGTYTGGNATLSADSGGYWTTYAAFDFMFEDWGTGVPAVTTQVAKDITGETATGQGNVTHLGGLTVTQHGHCWNTSTNPTTSNSKTSLGEASATGAFESSITGLIPGTGYYGRAYATNSAGTSYGANVYFVASIDTAGYIWMEGSNLHGFDENAVERIYVYDAEALMFALCA